MSANEITRLAQVDFRNDHRVFGIKTEDRLSHIYIIGKTGTGKSTLLETMALQDLEQGRGLALVDPHGDLVERITADRPRMYGPFAHHERGGGMNSPLRWREGGVAKAPGWRRVSATPLLLINSLI